MDEVAIGGPTGLAGKDLAAALDAVRGRVLAAATGLATLVAVFYTARQVRARLDMQPEVLIDHHPRPPTLWRPLPAQGGSTEAVHLTCLICLKTHEYW
ncbi:hypothetical protein [Nonomuraea sp. NPDC003709]|uniref:hypothetical protein n=1 Tax=Nonomuraea sp. NPDC003709 TaxID=3154450 RepID=UPI0033B4D5A8